MHRNTTDSSRNNYLYLVVVKVRGGRSCRDQWIIISFSAVSSICDQIRHGVSFHATEGAPCGGPCRPVGVLLKAGGASNAS